MSDNIMKKIEPNIIADIHFLPQVEGIKVRPIVDGYRPSFEMNGIWLLCYPLLEKFGKIFPGQSVKNVPIAVSDLDLVESELKVASEFRLREGNHVIAQGVITKLL